MLIQRKCLKSKVFFLFFSSDLDKYIYINLARILAPPEIKYRRRQGQGDAIERVTCGKWRISNWFYTTTEISKWGLIYFGATPGEEITRTLNTLAAQLPEVNRLHFLEY